MKVSLNTIGGGVIPEMFARELQKVLDNISDTKTKATAVRKIKLEIKIKPSEGRDMSETEVSCSASLAPVRPTKTFIYHQASDEGIVAETTDPRQQQLFGLQPGIPEQKKGVINE